MIRIKRINPKRKLLILDIDNTLLYLEHKANFKFKNQKIDPDFKIDNDYYGVFRPYLEKFLKAISKHYDIALWTTGNTKYANEIANLIFDPLNIKLIFVWSGNECYSGTSKSLDLVIEEFPEYAKKDIIALDDSPNCYRLDPENLIKIPKFLGDPNDTELLKVLKEL